MKDLPGYRLEALWDDGEFVLARGADDRSRAPRLVLRPSSARPLADTLAKLRHIHALRALLDSAWAARPCALIEREDEVVLVLEDCDADVLARLVGQPWPLMRFLRVAIGVASALSRAHAKGIVHKDLRPANLLVNAATGEAWLTGFGIASVTPREPAKPINELSEALNYTSPEQTGRTNHSIDARSDLYSLGVMLYELLTGDRPFRGRTALELIHAHLAMEPAPLEARIRDLPEPVCAIVGKLLAKAADERYQTAAGLETDLRRCFAEWSRSGEIGTFPLGEFDVSERLLIPETLYGREKQVQSLVDAFDEMANQGRAGIVLLSGYSGVGKSSVVNELRKVLGSRRALFASGKFDQYMRDIPYATLVQVLRRLLKHVLGMPQQDVKQWRAKLLDVLAGQGRLIADLVPEAELLIGEQLPVPELPANEAHARFQRVVIRFLSAFATRERPLTLFLDDLQWLDAATLDLLGLLAAQRDVRHLLLIGAYRNNEVGPDHPLTCTLEWLRAGGALVRQVEIAPLSLADIEVLLSDTLRTPPAAVYPLAELVYEKTGGNPLFTIQFLYEVADERLIALDSKTRTWRWDPEGIRAKSLTDNVLDLMALKLSRLPTPSQRMLAMLACLGSNAQREMLASLCATSTDAIETSMVEAVAAGFVQRTDGGYAFLHDRVQEAAYELMPAHTRAAEHLRIARILGSCRQSDDDERLLFDIVSHYNRALDLITDVAERKAVALLNLAAGRRARRSTAYASALAYFRIGRDLLPADRWDADYRLAFDLEANYAESEFLTGAPETAESVLAALASRAANPADDATVAWLRITLYTAMSRPDSAVQTCLEYLGRVGVVWSAHPGRQAAREAYGRLTHNVGARRIEELIDLPPLGEPAHRTTLDVLTAVLPPAFFTDADLVCLVLCHMANLSVVHGASDASPLAYAYLGMVLGPCFGDYRAGYEFGRLGLALVDQRGIDRFKARVYMCFAYHVSPWTNHINAERALLQRAFEAANEAGDLTYRGFSSCTLITSMLAAADPLESVERVAQERLALMREAKFGLIVEIMTTQVQLIRSLRGLTRSVSSFGDDEFDERAFEQRLVADPRLDIATCWHWIRKLQLLYIAGDHKGAIDAAARAAPLLWTSSGHFEHAEYGFHAALAFAGQYDNASPEERAELRHKLVRHAAEVQLWADHCPANFACRNLLVSAEVARIDGRQLEAIQLYERAAECARDGGFMQIEALANERAAAFCVRRGLRTGALAYLHAARHAYAAWGALGKVAQLERDHPELARDAGPTGPLTPMGGNSLELATVVTTSQAITSEAALDKLVHTLMELVLEHGGAQRGILILPRAEDLWIAARADVTEDRIEVSVDPMRVDPAELPDSLLRFAMRTQESALIADAKSANEFASDAYFQGRNVRSVLCMPLVKQKKTVGLLYLENNLASDVFTPSRLSILQLIASQAAISLENATLAEKQALLEEKEALLKEVHHRVKNNLQLVSSLLNLQANRVSDSAASQLLVESRNRVRSMALAHENLYRVGNFSRVSMAEHIRTLNHHLASVYGTATRQIELVTRVDDVQLDLPRAVSCGLIVNELVSNALKHAFPEGRSGLVIVELAATGDGHCELRVTDDGEGLPRDFQQRREDTIGMQLVHDLAAQLNGRVEASNGNGAKFSIRFDIEARKRSTP